MAGYVRQSTADIQPGQAVAAGPVTNEFNQLDAAFNGTTGHSHDGTSGNGPKINLTSAVTGTLQVGSGGTGGLAFNSALIDPTSTDDGYIVGATWVNTSTDATWICLDNTSSAAVWHKAVTEVSGTATVTNLVATTITVPTLTATTINAFTMGGNIDANNTYKIANLPTPSANGDVATKQYVDGTAFSSALPGIGPSTAGQSIINDGVSAFWADLSVDTNIWFSKYGF